jgi:hypothetical protein
MPENYPSDPEESTSPVSSLSRKASDRKKSRKKLLRKNRSLKKAKKKLPNGS